jgi:hypothetical protein
VLQERISAFASCNQLKGARLRQDAMNRVYSTPFWSNAASVSCAVRAVRSSGPA